MDRGGWWAVQSTGSKELDTIEQLILFLFSANLVLKSTLKLKKLLTKKACTLQDSIVHRFANNKRKNT